MNRKITILLLAFAFVAAAGSNAEAKNSPWSAPLLFAQADTTGTSPDSGAVAPADTAAAAPVAPAPAAAPAAAPPPTTPPPAAPAPAAAAPAQQSKLSEKIYYGGTVTIGFGSSTHIGVFPMIGYKVSPKLSAGAEFGYEYVSYDSDQSTHNYGGSVFGRYRVGRSLYAHAEYQQMNYEIFTSRTTSEREWVPALLLGGGFVKPLGGRSAAYAEVLFDVLQDEHSPYGDWEPVVNFGVSVGF